MLCAIVLEHQDICNLRWSIQLLGHLYASKVYIKRPNWVVATIGHRGTLDKSPSCCKQCAQDLRDCCIWLVMPGHQKCSHNKDRVWSHPWWPTSQWYPFKVVTWCALGTTKSRRSSVSTLGMDHRYKLLDEPWSSAGYPRLVCLLHWRHILPEVPSICLLLCLQPVQHCAQCQVIFVGCSPISNMHLYTFVACGDTYLLLQLVVTLNYSRVMNFSLMHWSQGDPVED